MAMGKMLVAGSAAAALIAGLTGTALAGTREVVAAGPGGYLSAGQTGTAVQVPWQTVGQGWELAQYNSTRDNNGHVTPGPVTLYLIDPAGGRYQMHRWAASLTGAPVLAGWSANKVQAVFLVPGAASSIDQLNLRTGAVTTTRLQDATGPIFSVGYAHLDGQGLLVTSGNYSEPVREYSLTGVLQRKLPEGNYLPADGGLLSPDGRQLVEGMKSGLRIISGTGQTTRTLRVPAGGCEPVRYWNSGSILALCSATSAAAPSRLWIVPADGRAPSALTSAHLTAPDLGNINAWQLPGGTYLQATGACGTLFIAHQRANGTTSQVNVPGTSNTHNVVVTARSGLLLVQAGNGCGAGDSLLWFNPANRHEDWLLRASDNAYGVVAVAPFASTENA